MERFLHHSLVLFTTTSMVNSTLIPEDLKGTYFAEGPCSPIHIKECFYWACQFGTFDDVSFLMSKFNIDIKWMRKQQFAPFHLACAAGQLMTVKHLATTLSLRKADVCQQNNIALRLAAAHGHLQLVHHFVKAFQLNHDEITCQGQGDMDLPASVSPNVLCSAAYNGHLDVVQFALAYFPKVIAMQGFLAALQGGHLDVVQSLFEQFSITEHDLADDDALYAATLSGKLDVVRYCVEMLNLKAVHLCLWRLDAFLLACSRNMMHLVLYFVTTFNLTIGSVKWKQIYRSALCQASANGHLQVVQYLVKTFGLTDFDVRWNMYGGIVDAAVNGHWSIVKYLAALFKQPTQEDVLVLNKCKMLILKQLTL